MTTTDTAERKAGPLSNEEYLATQTMLVALIDMVEPMPLEHFLQRARKADAVGLFIDPTAYMKAEPTLSYLIECADALADFRSRVRKARERLRQ